MHARLPALLFVAAFVALAGCSARGAQDPFAYTRKDLAHTSFDLASTSVKTDEQDFRVEDGSIATIKITVWVNATVGSGHVDIIKPNGQTALSTDATTTVTVPIDLGVWRILVHSSPDAKGDAAILAVRAGTSTGAS